MSPRRYLPPLPGFTPLCRCADHGPCFCRAGPPRTFSILCPPDVYAPEPIAIEYWSDDWRALIQPAFDVLPALGGGAAVIIEHARPSTARPTPAVDLAERLAEAERERDAASARLRSAPLHIRLIVRLGATGVLLAAAAAIASIVGGCLFSVFCIARAAWHLAF